MRAKFVNIHEGVLPIKYKVAGIDPARFPGFPEAIDKLNWPEFIILDYYTMSNKGPNNHIWYEFAIMFTNTSDKDRFSSIVWDANDNIVRDAWNDEVRFNAYDFNAYWDPYDQYSGKEFINKYVKNAPDYRNTEEYHDDFATNEGFKPAKFIQHEDIPHFKEALKDSDCQVKDVYELKNGHGWYILMQNYKNKYGDSNYVFNKKYAIMILSNEYGDRIPDDHRYGLYILFHSNDLEKTLNMFAYLKNKD